MSQNQPSPIVIERTFNASREQLWRAWTDPDQLKRWWGPNDWTTPFAETDVRVGGKYRYTFRAQDGQETYGTGVYREIVPLERLVMTDSFADAQGNVISAAALGLGDDIPEVMLMTVTFEDIGGGKTKMTLRHEGMPAGEMREMSLQGLAQSLDKLTAILA